MTPELACAFIARGIITRGSILQVQSQSRTAFQLISEAADCCIVLRALKRHKLPCFETCNPHGTLRMIFPKEIEMVDGMDIQRLASSHCLTKDGNTIVLPRRGRPRRSLRL
jgi:hypothetical protein